ncbi:transcription factor grauzone-like [Ochlerotatus camptorhynchus]|uniref:transcription factor grauzone-like n=1 Tax=Ochlerotatus camptorhynchus TaxID=644619 RepID=UPI0031CE88FF
MDEISTPGAEPSGSAKMEDIPEECRLCLDPFAENVVTVENPELRDRMEKVFHFSIEIVEKLPSGVCQTCATLINEFYRYSENVRSNQGQLISRLTRKSQPLPVEEIKVEPSLEFPEPDESIKPKDESPLPPPAEDGEENIDNLEVYADLYDPPRKRTRKKRKTASSRKKDRSTSSDADADGEKPNPKRQARKYNVKTKEEHEKDEQLVSEFYRMVCDLCGDHLENFSSLDSHFRENHDRSGFVVCCNKKIFKRCLMVEHMKLHTDPSAYRCEICNKNYKNKVYLAMHQVKQHGREEDRPFKCDRCKQSFAKNYQLRAHMVAHEKVQCPQCDRMLASKMALSTHLSNMHSDKDRRMICDSCGKEFLNKTCFERHVKEHMGIEVHPMLECHICHKWLKGERCLQKHIRYTHYETEQTHVCDICQQNYPNSRALWSHKRAVHVEEKFECEFCGKRFKRAVNLKEHRTIHTGEVLYACEFCGATMNSNANLYTHVKKSHPVEYAEKRQLAACGNAPSRA